MIGLISMITFLRLLKIHSFSPLRVSLLSNALLVGLFIGYLFKLDATVFLVTIASIALTLTLTYFLSSFFFPNALPALSLPFSIVAILLGVSAPHFTGLSDGSHYVIQHTDLIYRAAPFFQSFLLRLLTFFGMNSLSGLDALTDLSQEVFRSLGALFCIPDVLFGLLLLGVVGVYSPLTALFMIFGTLIGISAEKALIFDGTLFKPEHHFFNYALVFSSIAGVFLIPSRFSLIWATIGTLITVIFSGAASAFWVTASTPILALPFNLTVLFLLRTLRTIQPSRLNTLSSDSPETALDHARLLWLRHRAGEIGVFCPFEGEWTIQQGFNGDWTHRGNWAQALDFVVTGSNGKTFENQGIELSDYFAYGRPILAPVTGVVVSVCSTIDDNPIGKVNNQENWGNYVILKTLDGIYCALTHLQKDSLKVAIGETVTAGKPIAACGNSGYSQEPHLHLQVQLSPELGAYTVPFHLLNYSVGDNGYFHQTPLAGEKVKPFEMNLALDRVLTFKVGLNLKWRLIQKGRESEIVFKHCLDEISGRLYWTDGKSRLFYSKVGAQFYFYGLEGDRWSPLWDFLAAIPRLPIAFGSEIQFEDTLPLKMTHGFVRRFFALAWQMVASHYEPPSSSYVMNPDQNEMRGKVLIRNRFFNSYCKIDPMVGILEFHIGDRTYARIVS